MALEVPRDQSRGEGETGFVCFQVKRALRREMEENDGGNGGSPTLP